jgi:ankyrin repeat protein
MEDGFGAIHYAVANNDVECLKALLEVNATNVNLQTQLTKRTRLVSINTTGQTALHIACNKTPQAKSCLQLLLASGIDVNIKDERGALANINGFQ